MAPQSSPSVEVELDSRQRLPMAKIVKGNQSRFRVTKLAGGEYLLTPVVSISERELAVLRDPETMASLQRANAQALAGEGTLYPAGYFDKVVAAAGIDFDQPDDVEVDDPSDEEIAQALVRQQRIR